MFKTKLSESPELQEIFAEYCMKALSELINDSGEDEMEDKPFDINSFILKQAA